MKVLFMSGYPAETLSPHGRLVKDAVFLSKPFSRNELIQKVDAVLNHGPMTLPRGPSATTNGIR